MYSCQPDAIGEPGGNVSAEGGHRKAQCDQICNGVRGLTDRDVRALHIASHVARCYCRADAADGQEDTEMCWSLRQSGAINWSRTVKRLVPLHISGNGNCLEVACAFALWGFDSMSYLLHRLIYITLLECGVSNRYHERWCRQRQSDGCSLTSQQLSSEWDELVTSALPKQAAATDCRSSGVSSGSVPLSDSLQVFLLANVFRRTIVVLTSDSDCGGVYLPLLWDAADCIKYPVVLAFYQGRFVPLVGASDHSNSDDAVDFVPLVTSKFEPLRVWFLLDSEEYSANELTQRYMKMSEVSYTNNYTINMILGAQLKYENLDYDFVPSGFNTVQGGRNEAVAGEVQGQSTQRLDPTAPSASVSSLERIGREESRFREHEAVPQSSLLLQPCAHLGCKFYTSVHTHPFCHEHVSHGLTSAAAATQSADLSVTNTRCHQPECNNHASCFIYPYCYEHIERKIVENALVQKRPQLPSDMSLTMVACEHAGCQNMSSRFIYPYCYEHIESRFAETREARRLNQAPPRGEERTMSVITENCIHPGCVNCSSVWTYPVCYEHLDHFANKGRTSTEGNAHNQANMCTTKAPSGSEQYARAMEDIEARSRSLMTNCKNPGCRNFGNSRSRGYCNDCYQTMHHY